MITNKKYLVGVFDDEHKLVDAFERAQAKGVVIEEVYTPFPIHEILVGMKKKTRISYAAFFFGIFGALSFLGFMYYAAVISWPLHFGGKPFNAFPSFIIVTVVGTILTVTILTLLTFSIRSKIFPGKHAQIVDPRATDDKFIIVLDPEKMGMEPTTGIQLFESFGASEIYEKDTTAY
jgi:hypothetical protein